MFNIRRISNASRKMQQSSTASDTRSLSDAASPLSEINDSGDEDYDDVPLSPPRSSHSHNATPSSPSPTKKRSGPALASSSKSRKVNDDNDYDPTFENAQPSSSRRKPASDDEEESDGGEYEDAGRPKTNSSNVTSIKRSGDKPYGCDVQGCDKGFARRSDLVRHSRIHTNER